MSIEASQIGAPSQGESQIFENEYISFSYNPDNPGANFTDIVIDFDAMGELHNGGNPLEKSFRIEFDDDELGEYMTIQWDPKTGYKLSIENPDVYSDRYESMFIDFRDETGAVVYELLEYGSDSNSKDENWIEISRSHYHDGTMQFQWDKFSHQDFIKAKEQDSMFNENALFSEYFGVLPRFVFEHKSEDVAGKTVNQYWLRNDREDGYFYYISSDATSYSKPIKDNDDIVYTLDNRSTDTLFGFENTVYDLPLKLFTIDANLVSWKDIYLGIKGGVYDYSVILNKLQDKPIPVITDSQMGNLTVVDMGEQFEKAYPSVTFK